MGFQANFFVLVSLPIWFELVIERFSEKLVTLLWLVCVRFSHFLFKFWVIFDKLLFYYWPNQRISTVFILCHMVHLKCVSSFVKIGRAIYCKIDIWHGWFHQKRLPFIIQILWFFYNQFPVNFHLINHGVVLNWDGWPSVLILT